jgi:predicted transcriptional regulator
MNEKLLSKGTIKAIRKGLKDIEEGRLYFTEEVKTKLNIGQH